MIFIFYACRGGAGTDPSWHRSGSGMHKLNSVYDFVSCGKYLVDEGFVHKHQLTTVAHSAGCLLVGAAINMHPHLFQAAILKVRFRTRSLLLLYDPSSSVNFLVAIQDKGTYVVIRKTFTYFFQPQSQLPQERKERIGSKNNVVYTNNNTF